MEYVIENTTVEYNGLILQKIQIQTRTESIKFCHVPCDNCDCKPKYKTQYLLNGNPIHFWSYNEEYGHLDIQEKPRYN